MSSPSSCQFGPFTLDLSSYRLLRGRAEVPLTPKAFEVLALLVGRHDRVVTKQELFDAVWADTAVTENTLTQRIRELREALGDQAQESAYIRTIPRVGYQFVHEVRFTGLDAREGRERGTTAEAARVQPPPPDPAASRAPAGRAANPTWRVWAALAALVIGAAGAALVWSGSAEVFPEREHRLVSTFGGSPRSPSLSPDGAMVAFVMDADGVPQVWIAPVASGSPVQVTFGDEPASRPRWSPRGDQIVFERQGRGLWSVPPLGGTARQLIEHGSSPNFSADGSTIVFERGPGAVSGAAWGLWLADADGNNIRQIADVPDKAFWSQPSYPALSPDGQWVAFFRHSRGPRGDLWVVRATGGGARRLTRDEREGGAPVWRPDGRAVIFPSERRGSRTLWQVALDGGLEAVTTGAGADDEPDLSADGSRLVYVTRRDRFSIVRRHFPSAEQRTLLERPVQPWLPQVAPAGDRIAFFADVEGAMQIFTVGADGTAPRQVTFGRNQENIHPSWSWDGRWLYYYSRRPGPEGPVSSWRRIRADGREDTEVIRGWQWLTHNHAHMDPTGRFVLYTRIGTDTGDYSRDTTYVRDLRTGSTRALDGPHLHGAHWAPDGRRIAGQRHDGSIALCEAADGRCRPLLQGARPVWCADGRHLYFQRGATPTGADLWRVDLASGEEEALGPVGPFHPLAPAVSLTPEHEVVYTEYREGRREIWLIDWRAGT